MAWTSKHKSRHLRDILKDQCFKAGEVRAARTFKNVGNERDFGLENGMKLRSSHGFNRFVSRLQGFCPSPQTLWLAQLP